MNWTIRVFHPASGDLARVRWLVWKSFSFSLGLYIVCQQQQQALQEFTEISQNQPTNWKAWRFIIYVTTKTAQKALCNEIVIQNARFSGTEMGKERFRSCYDRIFPLQKISRSFLRRGKFRALESKDLQDKIGRCFLRRTKDLIADQMPKKGKTSLQKVLVSIFS